MCSEINVFEMFFNNLFHIKRSLSKYTHNILFDRRIFLFENLKKNFNHPMQLR